MMEVYEVRIEAWQEIRISVSNIVLQVSVKKGPSGSLPIFGGKPSLSLLCSRCGRLNFVVLRFFNSFGITVIQQTSKNCLFLVKHTHW